MLQFDHKGVISVTLHELFVDTDGSLTMTVICLLTEMHQFMTVVCLFIYPVDRHWLQGQHNWFVWQHRDKFGPNAINHGCVCLLTKTSVNHNCVC